MHKYFPYTLNLNLTPKKTPLRPLRQLGQSIPLNHHLQPLIHPLSPNLLIKPNTRLVPSKHTPFQPTPRHLQHLLCQILQQLKPIPVTARTRLHIQILQVDSRCGAPRRVVVEVEGHADGDWGGVCRGWWGGYQGCVDGTAFGGCVWEGEGLEEGFFCCFDFVEGFFVVG